jgi:hypothetical protein
MRPAKQWHIWLLDTEPMEVRTYRFPAAVRHALSEAKAEGHDPYVVECNFGDRCPRNTGTTQEVIDACHPDNHLGQSPGGDAPT